MMPLASSIRRSSKSSAIARQKASNGAYRASMPLPPSAGAMKANVEGDGTSSPPASSSRSRSSRRLMRVRNIGGGPSPGLRASVSVRHNAPFDLSALVGEFAQSRLRMKKKHHSGSIYGVPMKPPMGPYLP